MASPADDKYHIEERSKPEEAGSVKLIGLMKLIKDALTSGTVEFIVSVALWIYILKVISIVCQILIA